MPDPKNISPLLDGFTLGAPYSEHNGVGCCPAIKENSNKKYIVKIISVPASQSQFDALLLAGAYKDPGDAMEYFRETGEDILKEAELLRILSRIEGFLPYEGWQMEPITRRRLGYEVYLVGSYKRSLEKYIRKNAFTHLEAVNLGLDLCSALSVCRQSGFLYVDVKPSNIFVSEKKEYRIGDLGFLRLDALRYAALPERYFSPYTPPELLDPMTPLNLTVDTYGVGMILYQLYNDGQLPFSGTAPQDALPDPCHADYEMAEIIRKAIHPDPEQRWTDPKDLGKAIAAYMQRNRVNDIPITPFLPLDVDPEDIVVISEKPDAAGDPEPQVPEATAEEAGPADAQQPEEPAEPAQCETPAGDDAPPEATEAAETEAAESPSEELVPEPEPAPEEEPVPDAEPVPETEPVFQAEEPEEAPPLGDISEEVAKILNKADDIIAHEITEDTAFPAAEEQPDPFAFIKEDSNEPEPEDPEEPSAEVLPAAAEKKKKKAKHFADPTRKNRVKKFFFRCFLLLVLCCVSAGGFWYYRNVYLQPIDSISISGTQDQITVLVDTGVDESLLTVYCTDGSGSRKSQAVLGGKAVFPDLKPNTAYTIQVDMAGFHKLTGHTTDSFTTGAETQIEAFHAIAGSEDGSVKLDFTVNGEDPDFWNIRYLAEGEEERVETITGHSTMITGLTAGKVYTFTLDGGRNFGLSGETSVEFLASRLILAEEITLTSDNGSDITVGWKTPGDAVVESWDVRLYDGYGFEEQVTVTENQVQFSGIDAASHYTIEITAAGMTKPSQIKLSSAPILVTGFQMDEGGQTKMEITWEYTGTDPEGGWVLEYTVDGSGSQSIPCQKAEAQIAPLIPGANYSFTLQSADGKTVFNNTVTYQSNQAEAFTEHAFVPENVTFELLKTPDDSDWQFETLQPDAFTSTFHTGDSASMVMQSASPVYIPSNKVNALFVYRDSYGNVLPELVTELTLTWKNIWSRGDAKTGELDLPLLPTAPGAYVVEVYFNGGAVTQFDFTITE